MERSATLFTESRHAAGSTKSLATTVVRTTGYRLDLEHRWIKFFPTEHAYRRLRELHWVSIGRTDLVDGPYYHDLTKFDAQDEYTRAHFSILGQIAGTGRQGRVDIFKGLLDVVDEFQGMDGLEAIALAGLAAAAGVNDRDAFLRGLGAFAKHGIPTQLGGGAAVIPVFSPNGSEFGLSSHGDLSQWLDSVTKFTGTPDGLKHLPANLASLVPNQHGSIPGMMRPGVDVGNAADDKENYKNLVGFAFVATAAVVTKGNPIAMGIAAVAGPAVGAWAWNASHDSPPEPIPSAANDYVKSGAQAAVLTAQAAKDELDAAAYHNNAMELLAHSADLAEQAKAKHEEAEKADREGDTQTAEQKEAESQELKRQSDEARQQAEDEERKAQQKQAEADEKKKKAGSPGGMPADDGSTGGPPRPEWSIPDTDGGFWMISNAFATGPGANDLVERIGENVFSFAQIPAFSRQGNRTTIERAGLLTRNPALANSRFMPADDGGPGTPESMPADDGSPGSPESAPNGLTASTHSVDVLSYLVEATLTVGADDSTAALNQRRLRGILNSLEQADIDELAHHISTHTQTMPTKEALDGINELHTKATSITH